MSKFLYGCCLAASLLFAAACSREQQTSEVNPPESGTEMTESGVKVEAGHVFVKFKEEPAMTKASGEWFDGVTVTRIERLFPYAGKFEKRTREAGLHLWYDVWVDPQMPATKAQSEISLSDDVDIVECVPVAEVNDAERPFDDPMFTSQWNYQNSAAKPHHVKGCDINVSDAWKIETGDPGVIVAVTDMGVDYNHEDLIGNIWTNEAEANGIEGVDDDDNGYVDDIHGFNFNVVEDKKTMIGVIEPQDHGTHVAGIVAAMNGNGTGVCGIAGGKAGEKGATIMCCQALGGSYGGNTALATKYAADNGAVISQNSWSSSPSQALYDAIKYFIRYAGCDEEGNQTGPMAGGIFITSAGNNNETTSYPGQYPEVMAVASVGGDCQKSYFSNYGSWVNICAPGGDYKKQDSIYSTKINNRYGPFQGTSQACPHVSGVAALVVSKFGGPGFTNEKLWKILTENAADISEYNPDYTGMLGSGIVDAASSLLCDGPKAPDPVDRVVASVYQNQITFKWAVPRDEDSGKARYFNLYLSQNSLSGLDPDSPSSDVRVVKVPAGVCHAGDTLAKTITGMGFENTWHFRVRAYDNLGSASALSDEYTCSTDANRAPVITPLTAAEASIRLFESATMEFTYSDPDGHSMAVSYQKASDADECTITRDRITVTVTGSKGAPGTYHPVITVKDSYNLATKMELTYTIRPNHAPKLLKSFDDQVMSSLKESLSLPLKQYFSDEDGEDEIVSYTCSVETVGGGTEPQVSVSGDHLTVTSAGYGEYLITVAAKDPLGESAEGSFRLMVRNGASPVDLYPSPVIDYLNFRTSVQQSLSVELFNTSGAKVYTGTVEAGPFNPGKLDMSAMPGGVYTIKLNASGTPMEKKIVKL